ncbi:hypothetical protein M9Y10_024496 [Tritrichomonas musculus]|uniref:Choline transporter-like protein n=1 Tax=Tritrichomonas musculus TaxID=1915356 RepID=A0ABR2HC56_9EUKA
MDDIRNPLINKNKNTKVQKEDKLGEPYRYNPDFDGIEKERRCTDCFCFLIFILFLCGMIALFIISLPRSNYKYLYIPTDSRGLLCGYDNRELKVENSSDLPDLTTKKYLFWIRPGKPGFSRSFCVEECPKTGYFSDAYLSLKFDLNGFSKDDNSACGEYEGETVYPIIENYSEPKTVKGRFFCPYSTDIIIQRCFPTTKAFQNIADSVNKSEAARTFGISTRTASFLTKAVSDLYKSYITIIICVLGALILSLLWIVSLQCCAAFFVWVAVLLSAGGLGVLTWMCYGQWKNDFKNHQLIEKYTFGFVSEQLNRKIFHIFFIVMSVVDCIFLLLIIFLFDRITLSINIIQYVSKIFAQIPSLFFFPIFQYLLLFAWWTYVIGAAFVLFGSGEFSRGIVQYGSDPPIDKIEMKYDKIIQGFAIYHFFGFLWISFFIIALGEMTVAGTIAKFYFTRNKQSLRACNVFSSFVRSLKYHTGSLAFGSLIITIFKVLRMIVEYVDEKTTTRARKSNFATCVVRCCKCCLWCLEKFLKYLNRNAYVMIAIHGYNFWDGARNSFLLILRNLDKVVTLNWVGDFTMLLGKIFVSSGITALSLWFFMENDQIQLSAIPAVITFIMCYFAMGAFTSIYELAIDSTFICYMEDCERNDGVTHKKFASEKLIKMIDNGSNKEEPFPPLP